MAYAHGNEKGTYRSSSFDEVQGYEDLRMIWCALRDIARGKREPLRDDVRAKIVIGLEKTLEGAKASRTRNVAAAMILAMADGDFERDVYRKPNTFGIRLERARKSKRKGSGGSPHDARRGHTEGQATGGGDGEVDG